MAKITYDDKVTLHENGGIPDINKCRAEDLNEIKSVVNANSENIIFTYYEVNFDVTNASIGDWIIGVSTSEYPTPAGYIKLGLIPQTTSNSDKNFCLFPQIRGNYITCKMLLGYKGSESTLSTFGYIIYQRK